MAFTDEKDIPRSHKQSLNRVTLVGFKELMSACFKHSVREQVQLITLRLLSDGKVR
tara:strand:+ start:175 stop:342 length:168 start_codon:yes stop_codon:yes gene_type:complete